MSYFERAAEQLELNLLMFTEDTKIVWTDERVQLLRDLFQQGSSAWVARQINAQTGSNFTRNAIIGKAGRLGITTPKKKPVNLHSEGQLNRQRKARMSLITDPLPLGPVEELDEPEMRPMSYGDEWPNNRCRWGCGDPKSADFYFCGAEGCDVLGGEPFCRFHKKLAYTPARNAA